MNKNNIIGIICSSSSYGGLELNLMKLAIWLQERKNKVIFYAVDNDPLYNTIERGKQLELRPIKRHRKYCDIINAFRLRKRLLQDQVQVLIISHNRDISIAGICKTLMFNKLKIMYQQQMQIGSRKKDIFHTIRYSKIDAWLCPLNWLSEQVKKKTRVKPGIVHIVPFGIALEDFREDSITKTEARYKLGIPETALIIGVIGRLDPQKGQHFLIKCIYHLQKNHGDIHLLIVGESTKNEGDIYMNELRNLIKGCNLEEKIHLRPFLERPAIFYKAIDIFALASLSETCGTVIIEAMASGVPIIATNTGGTPELLEQGKLGFLYSPENQEEFLSQISFLLNNAGVAKEKAEKAREKAEKQFSNNYQCEKIEHIITKLLKH